MNDANLPQLGATLFSGQQKTRFRVWAPLAKEVNLEIVLPAGSESTHQTPSIATHPMQPANDGTFYTEVAGAGAGTLYQFSVDRNPGRPDPRSLFQPHGVHGPSQVVDRNAYQWTDQQWRGVAKQNLVIYELHLGLSLIHISEPTRPY